MTSTGDVATHPHQHGVDRWQRVGQISGWIAAVGLLAVTVSGVWLYVNYQPTAAAVFSDIGSTNRSPQGLFLPWDQMALQAVTVGTNMSGFSAIFDQEDITFVLIDGSEVSVATLRRWLVAHLFLGGLAVLAVLAPLTGRAVKGSAAISEQG